MILTVDGIYNNKLFIEYLCRRIKFNVLQNLNIMLLSQYYDMMFNQLFKRQLNGNIISMYRVLCYVMDDLQYVDFGEYSIIKLKKLFFLNNSNIKLYELCELMNYGNSVITPYPVISNAFEKAKKEIELYYEEFQNGLGDIII